MNYHAGTACRNLLNSLITIHTGVQYFDAKYADAISAVLLIITCIDQSLDLARVSVDYKAASQYLHNFLSFNDADVNKSITCLNLNSKQFCKSRIDDVKLYCFCLTPWIDGSTSLTIYEKQQKAYHCNKCDSWFHKGCLAKLDIQPPKRNAEFICSKCSVPATIPWQHSEFTNTCTSDNFLTILLLHCNQHPMFLSSCLGSTDIENALKAAILLMQKGNIKEGKSLILKAAHFKLNFQCTPDGKYDCYGSEDSHFLRLLSHIWKLQVLQKCTSSYCPNKNRTMTRYQTTFSVPKSFSSSKDIQQAFPLSGVNIGYCGSQFSEKPPKEAPHGLTDHIDMSQTKKRVEFYECKGKLQIVSTAFISKKPWIIPVNIEPIDLTHIKTLPLSLSIYNHQYKLGGCSINVGEHFVAIIMWHGRPYIYDGLKHSKAMRFMKCYPDMDFSNCTGSYAYYFVLH